MRSIPYGRAAVLATALAVLLALPSAGALAQEAPTINLQAASFDQTEVHVQPGQSVLWNNGSAVEHNVTADDGSFKSDDLEAGDQFSMEFDTPGTYAYYCSYHGGPGGVGMSGVIVVDAPADAGAADPGSADPPADPAPVNLGY